MLMDIHDDDAVIDAFIQRLDKPELDGNLLVRVVERGAGIDGEFYPRLTVRTKCLNSEGD